MVTADSSSVTTISDSMDAGSDVVSEAEGSDLSLNMVSAIAEYSNMPQPVNNITVSSHIKHFFI